MCQVLLLLRRFGFHSLSVKATSKLGIAGSAIRFELFMGLGNQNAPFAPSSALTWVRYV